MRMADLWDDRTPAAASARSSPGRERPPSPSAPIGRNARRDGGGGGEAGRGGGMGGLRSGAGRGRDGGVRARGGAYAGGGLSRVSFPEFGIRVNAFLIVALMAPVGWRFA